MGDPDGLSDADHRAVADEMYERWRAGEPKSQLEIEYWSRPTSHGKAFTAYVKKWLGLETEKKSLQAKRLERLEALLRAHGIAPTDAGDLSEPDRLVAKSRESALAALRIYNDPSGGFRTESFILLMFVAWNSALQAILEIDGRDYYSRADEGEIVLVDGRPRVLETKEILALAMPGDEHAALRANLDFFLGLRNQIAHRYLPALDVAIVSEAQSMLLNFENLLVDQFGDDTKLGDRLAVPLQLAGFRDDAWRQSLRKAQSQLPTDVQEYLARHRQELPDEVLRSPNYALQVFFVPLAANRERSADAVVNFVRPGDVTPELEGELQQLTVVTKPKQISVASGDLLRPKEVVNLVGERLPYRFTLDTHTRCWRHYGVRPASGAAEPAATVDQYCRWDRLMAAYGYTRAWVDKLVKDLSDPDEYSTIVGIDPLPR
jgi:hypothetical protein